MSGDKLYREMVSLYEDHIDPWKYEQQSRHGFTVGVCSTYWSGGSLVEVPCAEGVLTEHLARLLEPKPEEVVGYDLVGKAVRRATERFEQIEDPPRYRFEPCDVRAGLPANYEVDMYVISDLLPYIPKQADSVVMQAAGRVKRGGYVVLTSWTNGHDLGPCFGNVPMGTELVNETSWVGEAIDLEGEVYPTTAEYRVLRRR